MARILKTFSEFVTDKLLNTVDKLIEDKELVYTSKYTQSSSRRLQTLTQYVKHMQNLEQLIPKEENKFGTIDLRKNTNE